MRLLLLLLTLAAATLAANAEGAAGHAAADCSFQNDPPAVYADDIVLTNAGVTCASPQKRVRISAELLRDGVVVNAARRDCRRATTCQITVDASVTDPPGDQVYCVHAAGDVNGALVGESTACEAEGF